METYKHYLSFAIGMAQDMQQRNELKLVEIEEEWWKSAEYPRKKKKAVRKRLIVEYNIFSYAKDIFNF